jgi:hypothetical protein
VRVHERNVVSPWFSLETPSTQTGLGERKGEGKRAARRADRTAGKGWWRKQRPACNGLDRG